MNITTKSRYAIRALVDIAIHQQERGLPVRRSDIGTRESFSQDYLEQILVRLRSARIVKSVRGPGGGYLLGRDPTEITLWEVMTASEDKLAVVPCLSDDDPRCGRHEHCSARPVWQHMFQVLEREMGAITLQDIIDNRLPELVPKPPKGTRKSR